MFPTSEVVDNRQFEDEYTAASDKSQLLVSLVASTRSKSTLQDLGKQP